MSRRTLIALILASVSGVLAAATAGNIFMVVAKPVGFGGVDLYSPTELVGMLLIGLLSGVTGFAAYLILFVSKQQTQTRPTGPTFVLEIMANMDSGVLGEMWIRQIVPSEWTVSTSDNGLTCFTSPTGLEVEIRLPYSAQS